MKKLFLILFAFLCMNIAAAAGSDARPEVSPYVKAYTGNSGVKVWTTRVGPAANNEALVQITGIDSPLDKRIQKLKTEVTKDGSNYITQVDGKRFVMFIVKGSYGELYLPGSNDALTGMRYSQSLSEQGNSEHFLTDYLSQK